MEASQNVRALVLMSGGLDSQLAACLLREQGVDLRAVVFTSPFFDSMAALQAARTLEIPIEEIDFTNRMVKALEACPAFDEPSAEICIACHREMIKCAAESLEPLACDFLVTGEVLNQRIPTQSLETLAEVDRYAGQAGRVLRPLSAGALPETIVEEQGWVDRTRLLAIEGAQRKEQLQQAEKYKIQSYPEPANPCRLTDPAFAVRLRDLRAHEGLQGRRSLSLLRLGRHFRLGPVTKLIVARNESENLELQGHAELYELLLQPSAARGAVGMVPIIATEDQIKTAAAVCAKYSAAAEGEAVQVRVRSSRKTWDVEVVPADEKQLDLLRI